MERRSVVPIISSQRLANLDAPMANLPVVIFQFAMSPYKDWQSLAWTGAALRDAMLA